MRTLLRKLEPVRTGLSRRSLVIRAMKRTKLLVLGGPDAPELKAILPSLPSSVEVVAVGKTVDNFDQIDGAKWGEIDVLLNCGVGENAAKRQDIQVGNLGADLMHMLHGMPDPGTR